MYNIKLATTVLTSALIFTSCNNNSDSKSGPVKSREEILKDSASSTDYSKKIPLNNYTIIKRGLTYNEKSEMYTVGCVTPGQQYGKSINQVDEKLAIGQVFTEQYGGSNILRRGSSSTVEDTIIKVENMSYVYEQNYLAFDPIGPFNVISDVFTQKPHLTLQANIVDKGNYISSESKLIASNYTESASKYISDISNSLSDKYISCSYDYKKNDSKTEERIDKFSYSLQIMFGLVVVVVTM